MKIIKKYVILIIIAMILVLGISSKVFAFELIPNLENIDMQSRKITILLDISDLLEYKDGINVVSGKLIYDKNVFENILFNGTNGWTSAYNYNQGSEDFGKFVLITTSGSAKEKQEIAQINLIVKDGIENVRTKIKIEALETSYNSQTIKAEDKEIKLDITKNEIKIAEETEKNIVDDVKNDQKTNNNMYIIIICIIIILIVFLILIIKFKRKGGRNND